MKNPPTVREGDEVIVTLRGKACPHDGDPGFELGAGSHANRIAPYADHVVHIEVMKPQLVDGQLYELTRQNGNKQFATWRGDSFQGFGPSWWRMDDFESFRPVEIRYLDES